MFNFAINGIYMIYTHYVGTEIYENVADKGSPLFSIHEVKP